MDSKEYAKIIARNLKRIAYEHKRSQADIARDLKLKQSTVSTWMVGKRIPRMDKIDMLCHYFNCSRADIMEEHQDNDEELILSKEERNLVAKYRELSPHAQETIRMLIDRYID